MFGLGKPKHAHPRGHAAHAHAHANDFPKQSRRGNRIRGLKAAINNPRTTSEGRDGAEAQLKTMGVRPNKPTLGTRIRHLFGLPGKTHHQYKTRPVRTY